MLKLLNLISWNFFFEEEERLIFLWNSRYVPIFSSQTPDQYSVGNSRGKYSKGLNKQSKYLLGYLITRAKESCKNFVGYSDTSYTHKFSDNRPFSSFCLFVKTSLRVKPFIWKCVPPTGSFSWKSNSFSYRRFARRLILKQRNKVSRKWPIIAAFVTQHFCTCD